MSWQDRAACVGQPLNLFFPANAQQGRKAKALCQGCPVENQCLNFVLKREDPAARYGIYAGLTATERNLKYGTGAHELAS